MKFILIDEQRRSNAIAFLNKLDIKKTYQVFIKPYKKNRTVSQNNTYWMWLSDIAPVFGYTENELHEILKVRFLGVVKYMVDGVELVKPISTKTLKTKEMAEFLIKVEVLARQNEIKIRIPDDYKYAMGYK